MTDCFGLCRLFDRKHSNGKMGADSSKESKDNLNYVVVPAGDNMVRRSVNTTGQGPLNLEWINYCFTKNGQKHRSDMYYCMTERNPTLVVRRGLPICFNLKFDREFDIATDNVSFMFKLAEAGDTNFGNNTQAVVPLKSNPTNGNGHWSAYVMRTDDVGADVVSVRITPPNNCIVGQWVFDVDTRLGQEAALFSARGNPIYILFNPWCPTDEVYIRDDRLREEYVLCEEGLMWRGSHSRQKKVMWTFGQFQKNMLESSFLLLLKIRRLALIHCSDPVKVSRNLSAAVNAPDELGVIVGNWTEDFSGGNPPINWLGSADILNQFIKTKKPVKYGQCWVYAGVLTTVCRAIGIPCRPVTAYCAAHDTQNSLTIDYMVDENGKILEELQSDSIWNYHVWNEVWMARPDLNVLDRSWQVIDATPQELSEGQYKCGPSSVTAVKNGDIRAPYDTAFVYSEVNADKVYWRYYGPSQPTKLLRKDTEAIGKLICTKAVGKWEQENITDNYKYPENSNEERLAMHSALKQNSSIFSRYYLNEDFNEIKFDFELVDDIIVGENFRVAVKITNKGHKDYTVNVILRVDTVDYTGKNGSLVTKIEQQKVVLHDPGANVEYVQTALTYFDYGKDVKSQNVFNISCLASVVDTDYEYFGQDDFRVRKPDIVFEMVDKPAMSHEVKVNVKFRNPLPVSLKDGRFLIAGSSLPKTLELKVGRKLRKFLGIMVNEDSVWCCIWPSHCVPPPVETQYLNDYTKLTLLIVVGCSVFCLFRKSVKRKPTETNRTATARENDVAAATATSHDPIAAADSMGKLKRVLRKVASQTNKVCAGNGEGMAMGKAMGSLWAVRDAIGEFVREADHEQQQLQRGEPTATAAPGAHVAAGNKSPQSPPPPPPELIVKQVHSALS